MTDYEDIDERVNGGERPPDPPQEEARERLRGFFDEHRERVFYSRQVEIFYENDYFHWITNRAIRDLESEGLIKSEWRTLRTTGKIKLVWHRNFRFYKRSAARVYDLVDKFSDPQIGDVLGNQGELMIQRMFSQAQFVMRGYNTREHNGSVWTATDHNMDFIFERDSIAYGVEVKNMLGYMDKKELDAKIRLCQGLNLRPVIAARMLPRVWANEIIEAGGYALIYKYQLYPLALREFAKSIREELGLPVDSPRTMSVSTMAKFLQWHLRNL